MQYQLTILEALLLETPAAIDQKKKGYPEPYQAEIQAEISRFKKTMLDLSYSNQQEYILQLFIEHHLHDLIQLADTIYRQEKSAAQKEFRLMAIDKLINFLFSHFPQYCNQDLQLPLHQAIAFSANATRQLQKLSVHFSQQSIPLSLQQILITAFENLVAASPKISFRLAHYLSLLFEELLAVTHESDLRAVLIRLNFNNANYVLYATEEMNLSIHREKTMTAKRQWIEKEKQRISCLTLLPNIGWQARSPTLQDRLLDHLLQLPLEIITDHQPANTKETRIAIDLSAPELALMLRLCVERHLFPENNRPFLLRKLATYFCSRGTKEKGLSWESLNTKYSAVEQHTVDHIRSLLIDLLNSLRKIEKELR
jgi:hypothetical protein